MVTAYIDRKNTQVIHRAGVLEFRVNDKFHNRLPLSMLERIVVIGKVLIDTSTLAAITNAGIPVNLLGGRQYRHHASIYGPLGLNGQRRLLQYHACQDPELARELATCILRRKLASQQRFLSRALVARPDKRLALKKSIGNIARLREKLRTRELDRESLRGVEGAAAASYFSAYATILPPACGFGGRKRRPPPDPVNAALSLGYSLLYTEAANAVHMASLDPALGFLHEPLHGRASLAADLVEPLRARHDEMVWELFASRRLEICHFQERDGGFWLGKQGRRVFFGNYEERARTARRWLKLFVLALVRRIEANMEAGKK